MAVDPEAQRRREECERKARRGEMDPRLEFVFQLLMDGTQQPRHQIMDHIFEGDMVGTTYSMSRFDADFLSRECKHIELKVKLLAYLNEKNIHSISESNLVHLTALHRHSTYSIIPLNIISANAHFPATDCKHFSLNYLIGFNIKIEQK